METTVKRTYIGLVHKERESDYGVSFQDLPGCVTAAHTLEEAKELAAEALALHLEGLTSSGNEIPEPSSADAVVAHPDTCDATALLVVDAFSEQAEIQVPSS